ncbi:MAG: acylphosphatase [Epsilonproteobacteria bacterium]|nr:acylphosphatase [Campylobacterota bacterium]
MDCLKFIVKGKVQGVWYRKYTSINFNKHNIIGYVKNLPNGDVEVVVKKDKDTDIQKIFEILREGSPKSEVKEIIMGECDEEIEFGNRFEVRY